MTYFKAHHRPSRFFRGVPQFIEVKQLVDIEARFRAHCRAAIRRYRENRLAACSMDDPLERHYREIEAAMSRRRAEDAIRLYAVLRRDARRSVRAYVNTVRAAAQF